MNTQVIDWKKWIPFGMFCAASFLALLAGAIGLFWPTSVGNRVAAKVFVDWVGDSNLWSSPTMTTNIQVHLAYSFISGIILLIISAVTGGLALFVLFKGTTEWQLVIVAAGFLLFTTLVSFSTMFIALQMGTKGWWMAEGHLNADSSIFSF